MGKLGIVSTIIQLKHLLYNTSVHGRDWAKPTSALMHNGSISTTGLFAVYVIIIIFLY